MARSQDVRVYRTPRHQPWSIVPHAYFNINPFNWNPLQDEPEPEDWEICAASPPPKEDDNWLAIRSLVGKSMVCDSVVIDKTIRGGVPVLRGTRISISQIFAELSDAECVLEFAEEYDIDPSLIRKLLAGMAIHFDKSFLK